MEGALGWRNGNGAREWVKKRAPDAEMDGYVGGYIRAALALAVSSTVELLGPNVGVGVLTGKPTNIDITNLPL